MTVDQILIIIALVCFGLAAVGVVVPRVHFGWLGLVFYALSLLI